MATPSLDTLLGIAGDPDVTPQYQKAHREDSKEEWREYAIFLEEVILVGVDEWQSISGLPIRTMRDWRTDWRK